MLKKLNENYKNSSFYPGATLSPALLLASKIFQGVATAKEREDYMTFHSSEAERIMGKPLGEMSYEESRRYHVLDDNLREGKLDGEYCSICKNKGYIALLVNGYECQKECSCMASRRANEKLIKSELEDYITSKTFENFEIEDDQHRYALTQAKNFIRQKKYPFMYIGGTTGTGKSHLSVATLYKLIQQGYMWELVKWESEYNNLNTQKYSEPISYRKRVAHLKFVDVLVIDDILWHSDNSKPTNAEWKTVKEILDERSIRGLKTLMSSNYTMSELFNLNPVVGGRISEFTGNVNNFAIDLNGKNYRLKRQEQMSLVEEDIGF